MSLHGIIKNPLAVSHVLYKSVLSSGMTKC